LLLSLWQGNQIKQVSVDYITPDDTIPKDPDTQKIVDKWLNMFGLEAGIVIGITAVELHADKLINRCKETNVGDFVADTMRKWALEALSKKPGIEQLPIVVLMNSGSLRWNTNISAESNLTKKDILDLHPFGNVVCVISTAGYILRQALENSVSQLPIGSGRFLQISGFNFSYTCRIVNTNNGHCDDPPGSRVLNITLIDGTPVRDDTLIYLVCPDFILNGGDEYTMLTGEVRIIDPESGDSLIDLVMDEIKEEKIIAPVEDGRLIEAGKTQKH